MTDVEGRCWRGKTGPVCWFFKALNAMLKTLAFHLKAARSLFSRGEIWSGREGNDQVAGGTAWEPLESKLHLNPLAHPPTDFSAPLIQAPKTAEGWGAQIAGLPRPA